MPFSRLSRAAFATCVVLLGACSSTGEASLPVVPGLAVTESDGLVSVTLDRLVSALEAAEPVGIVARVDHRQNAATAGLTLRPTRVVLFGNPALGTPLMQANPQAGLDLPQKVLVYEDAEGRTVVGYNTAEYLADRHGVGGVATLEPIARALDEFAQVAAGNAPGASGNSAPVARSEGIVTVPSQLSFDDTWAALRAAVAANENLTIVAELDHQANAARVGLELGPLRLLVFGNPTLGTPLMQAGQTAGIDLPQKMLVYQDAEGDVFVAYNDPDYVADRHGLGRPPELATIADALAGLASVATATDE